LLPDFYASRTPGTLDDIEHTAATAETVPSIERAAEQLRPGDTLDAVTLPAAIAWLRRHLDWVRALLITVASLFPERFANLGQSVRAWRDRLETSRVLVALREICEVYLYALPRPLGLNPPGPAVAERGRRTQQSTGSEPPQRSG
jgi:hypothetical protein